MSDGYPLDGINVLDFTHYIAGPYCSQVLADLGATVLKVERRGRGDPYRAQGPVFLHGESVSFLAVNRGKRSIALELSEPADLEIALSLIDHADVLVENMKPGAMRRWGLDYETVSARAPQLVYCSLSGFGHVGPLAHEGAYDLTVQALSGLLSMTGHPDQPPAKVPVAALDFGTALYGVIGVLAALWQRVTTHRGQWVQSSLLETSLAWMSMHIALRGAGGSVGKREGTRSPFFAPYEAYATSDGYIVVVGTGGDAWERFCGALELTEVVRDPRFVDNRLRVKNADELKRVIEERLRTQPTSYWSDRLSAAGVPFAPVQKLDEALSSKQVLALDVVRRTTHPVAGEVSEVRLPITFSEASSTSSLPAPGLDQHRAVGFDLLHARQSSAVKP
jgi:crotonobetainyl-CoA:carnitine CoA-transferase CaiB-like acyl-CoA transferase